jgi:hemolysin III
VLELFLLKGYQPQDGGPIYAETLLWHSGDLIEPWNAISSLTFLLPVFFWLYKLRGNYKKYAFLIACMPFLAIGGIGSTLYHAFRISNWLLFMDFVPIALLNLLVGAYIWYKLVGNWFKAIIIIVLFQTIRFSVQSFVTDTQTAINFSYFLNGVMMFLPILIILIKTKFEKFYLLLLTVTLFGLALFFRYYDDHALHVTPAGTHWLWHIACAAGVMPLSYYLFYLRDE